MDAFQGPENDDSGKWMGCALGLRKEREVPLWLYHSQTVYLIQSLTPRFSLCKMKVESSMISIVLLIVPLVLSF